MIKLLGFEYENNKWQNIWKLKEKGMSQKEFSQKTGIAESSISDWKKITAGLQTHGYLKQKKVSFPPKKRK